MSSVCTWRAGIPGMVSFPVPIPVTPGGFVVTIPPTQDRKPDESIVVPVIGMTNAHPPPSTTPVVGDTCTICSHSSLVHPGPHNPALIECAICRILKVSEEMSNALEAIKSVRGIPF